MLLQFLLWCPPMLRLQRQLLQRSHLLVWRVRAIVRGHKVRKA